MGRASLDWHRLARLKEAPMGFSPVLNCHICRSAPKIEEMEGESVREKEGDRERKMEEVKIAPGSHPTHETVTGLNKSSLWRISVFRLLPQHQNDGLSCMLLSDENT